MFWLVILEGFWVFYNFLTLLFDKLPFINVVESNVFIIDLFATFALRWSPVVGIFLTIIGILGVVLSKRSENNLKSVKVPALVFGLVYSILLML